MRSRFVLLAVGYAIVLSACQSPSTPSESVGVAITHRPPVQQRRDPGPGALPALRALNAAGEVPPELAPLLEANLGTPVEPATLTRFLPQTLLEYTSNSQHEIVPEKSASRVERKYARGTTTLTVSITDTSKEPEARAAFAFVHLIRQVSAQGYKQGSRNGGRATLAEWKNDGTSTVQTLIANRFVVRVRLRGAERGAAEQVAAALDADGLAALAATNAG